MTGDDYEELKSTLAERAGIQPITQWAPEVFINMIAWPTPGVQTYVLYADHVEALLAQQNEFSITLREAVQQAEQRVWDTAVVPRIGKDRFDQGYEQGQRDAMTGTGVALYELGQRDAQAKHADCICSDTAAIYRVDGKVVSIGLTDEAGGVFERREDVLNEAVQRVEALPFIHREAVIAAIKGDSDE